MFKSSPYSLIALSIKQAAANCPAVEPLAAIILSGLILSDWTFFRVYLIADFASLSESKGDVPCRDFIQ